ncbi:L,D-transpeptidase family protein [Vibrio sp.]|uniref:L,D-transpeptidase family protein n=1 Tax=Vibrio sp. TaxID=678 RepID=UPI003D0BCF65
MKHRFLTVGLLLLFSFPLAATPYFTQLGWLTTDENRTLSFYYPQTLAQLYHHHNDQRIWTDMLLRTQFEEQLELIHRAKISPLFSHRLALLIDKRQHEAWLEYDLLATDTLLMYLSYAERAEKEGMDWFFNGNKLERALPLPSEAALLALHIAVGSKTLDHLIFRYTPQDPTYQQLIYAYRFLRPLTEVLLSDYQQSGLKRVGDKLEDRQTLIQRLALVNIDITTIRDDVSWYDNSLVKPIKQFQKLHGLVSDEIIGPNTLKWLNLSVDARLGLIALNAERMRLWPSSTTAIVVNLPNFELKYWHSGETVFQSKVVVGRVTRPTPIMTVGLDSLIVNPTWNVPYKIMVEDILPMAKRDSQYLTRQHMEILPRWGSQQTMDPALIDWENIQPESFPYRLRQQAGYRNALGRYKFNTPNRRAIFLHDTPSKHLFDYSSRAFSSGCIRVENADLFANTLLKTQGLDDQTDMTQSREPNHAIALKQRIPVQIIYQTTWYDAGQLHFRDDIYHLDRVLTQ